MEIWLCSLTRAAEPYTDMRSAVQALRRTLDRERKAGKTVKPAEVNDRVGQVYTVRGAGELERYWLSHDRPE